MLRGISRINDTLRHGGAEFAVSRESHDACEAVFLVDGEVVATSDGESTWKQVSVNLSGGKSHTVTWRYVKDGSGSAGEDCVWVSGIQFASLADEETSGELLDESEYNWFFEDEPAAFSEEEPFEYTPVVTPENATCQIDLVVELGEIESSALLDECVDGVQAAIAKIESQTGLDYAVLTAEGWAMVGNENIGDSGNGKAKVSVVVDYSTVPSTVMYMISGHTLTNGSGVAVFTCAAQKSSVQSLIARGEGTINSWAGKYEVVNSDVQEVPLGTEMELSENLETFTKETFRVTGGGTLVIPGDRIPAGGVNRKLHVDSNSTVKFDLSGLSAIPTITKLFNGVGGSFVIGKNMQLAVPGEGVERVSKLFVKDGNLEARVAERPTMGDSGVSDSPFAVNTVGEASTVSASINNAVEGFWYGLTTAVSLQTDFVLDKSSLKRCDATGVMKLEAEVDLDAQASFYKVRVDADRPNE